MTNALNCFTHTLFHRKASGMLRQLFFLLLFLLLFTTTETADAKKRNTSLHHVHPDKVVVFDGDTLLLKFRNKHNITLRLFGIDAPEVAHKASRNRPASTGQPWGEEAKKSLLHLIRNKPLSYQIMDTDRYKRQVVILYTGKRNINLRMIQQGDAWAYRHYLRYTPEEKPFLKAEKEARRAKRGLWKHPHPVPPWKFRHRR